MCIRDVPRRCELAAQEVDAIICMLIAFYARPVTSGPSTVAYRLGLPPEILNAKSKFKISVHKSVARDKVAMRADRRRTFSLLLPAEAPGGGAIDNIFGGRHNLISRGKSTRMAKINLFRFGRLDYC